MVLKSKHKVNSNLDATRGSSKARIAEAQGESKGFKDQDS